MCCKCGMKNFMPRMDQFQGAKKPPKMGGARGPQQPPKVGGCQKQPKMPPQAAKGPGIKFW